MDRQILATAKRAQFLDDGNTCCICIPDRGRKVLVTMLRANCADDTGAEKLKICYGLACYKVDVTEATDTLTLDGYEGETDRHFVVRYPDGKTRVVAAESVNEETGTITFDNDIEAGNGIKIYPLGFEDEYDTFSLAEGINTLSGESGVIVGDSEDMPVEIFIDDLVEDSTSNIEACIFMSI